MLWKTLKTVLGKLLEKAAGDEVEDVLGCGSSKDIHRKLDTLRTKLNGKLQANKRWREAQLKELKALEKCATQKNQECNATP